MLWGGGGGPTKSGTKYTTRNQMQIFHVVKYIENFEVTLTTHLVHSFIII